MSTINENRYRADLREVFFLLFEQFKLGRAPRQGAVRGLGRGRGEHGRSTSATVRVRGRSGRSTPSATREGCRLEDGQVTTPDRLQGGVEEALRGGLEVDRRRRRARRRRARRASLHVLVEEMLSRREHRVQHVPGPRLRRGRGHRTPSARPEQKKRSTASDVRRHVGRHDVPDRAAGRQRRRRRAQHGRQEAPTAPTHIRGTKIFISGGDHDLAENIIHLVLARVDGAPAGTKGLTLFIVPKIRVDADGTLGEPNDVTRRRHRAQDGHQRLGDLRAQLRRERRLHRRARRRRRQAQPGHAADVQA